MEKLGLVHIYTGDGKGKTTASVGLAVRMAGYGARVVFCQFLKGDASGERKTLSMLPGVEVLPVPPVIKFIWNMNAEEKAKTAEECGALFAHACRASRNAALLVLDEAIGAVNCGMLNEDELIAFLENRPKGLEVVLTGRDPSEKLMAAADYISEIRNQKHPFDRGVSARKGVEY